MNWTKLLFIFLVIGMLQGCSSDCCDKSPENYCECIGGEIFQVFEDGELVTYCRYSQDGYMEVNQYYSMQCG